MVLIETLWQFMLFSGESNQIPVISGEGEVSPYPHTCTHHRAEGLHLKYMPYICSVAFGGQRSLMVDTGILFSNMKPPLTNFKWHSDPWPTVTSQPIWLSTNCMRLIPSLTFTELWVVSMEHLQCGMPAGNAYPSGHLVPSPFRDLLVLQLLRPDSSNLPCLYSTFHP